MDFFSIPGVAIAISVVICWALFAIFCSLIHEAVTQIKAERGRFMRRYLLQQLYDKPNQINWGNEVYKHGSIAMLSRDRKKPSSDIEPTVFATALVSAIARSHLVQSKVEEFQQEVKMGSTGIANQQQVNETVLQLERYQHPVLKSFKAGMLLLQQSEQKQLLTDALEYAEIQSPANEALTEAEIYQHLCTYLAGWFTELTERLTLWYKKKTRQRLFWLGFLLALVLNVDSVDIFTIVNNNPAAQKILMGHYEKNTAVLEKIALRGDSLTTDSAAMNKLIKQYMHESDSLAQAAKLPIGLKYSPIYNTKGKNTGWYLLKIAGLFISAFAASLGAPFWFDVLRKAYTLKS